MKQGTIMVDIPQRCEDCNFCKNYIKVQHAFGEPDTYEVHCTVIGNKTLMKVPKDKKPNWCPIMEI